jgi:hypothetical protein
MDHQKNQQNTQETVKKYRKKIQIRFPSRMKIVAGISQLVKKTILVSFSIGANWIIQ